MTYDNIKSHKKPGLHPLSRICIFEKTTGGWGGDGLKLTLTLAFQRLDKVFLVAMSQ